MIKSNLGSTTYCYENFITNKEQNFITNWVLTNQNKLSFTLNEEIESIQDKCKISFLQLNLLLKIKLFPNIGFNGNSAIFLPKIVKLVLLFNAPIR